MYCQTFDSFFCVMRYDVLYDVNVLYDDVAITAPDKVWCCSVPVIGMHH